jgi:hypothetical protein
MRADGAHVRRKSSQSHARTCGYAKSVETGWWSGPPIPAAARCDTFVLSPRVVRPKIVHAGIAGNHISHMIRARNIEVEGRIEVLRRPSDVSAVYNWFLKRNL